MALLERHFKMSLTLVLFKSAIFCLVYKLPLFSQVKKYPTFPTLCPYSAVADLPPETALATPIAKGCCWQANQELLPGTSPTATSSSYLYRLHKVTLEKLHNPWFWKPTQEKVVWWGWVQILTLSLVLQMVASLSLSSFIFNLGLWFFFFFFFVSDFFKIWSASIFDCSFWFWSFPINELLITWAFKLLVISDDGTGRFLFSPEVWIFQKCYFLFSCPESVGKLHFLIKDFWHSLGFG